MTQINISRAVGINATPDQIRPFLTDFRSWRDWSPLDELDPALHREYRGAETGVGAVYEWSGNKSTGSGVMTITAVTEDHVQIHLESHEPFKGSSDHTFSLDPVPGKTGPGPKETTEVTWTMVGFPQGVRGLVAKLFGRLEPRMAEAITQGLLNLKDRMEIEPPVGGTERAGASL
ncbi:SRPBCC family protein [Zhihengliuella sp.]|uniref:SRPBCC family protein n=1 Tax=Zhihengliuella sp. TaxID=1954483 RepID=UPI0028116D78|nr:SRPBCC family protein [Zhihengliuella sp.]